MRIVVPASFAALVLGLAFAAPLVVALAVALVALVALGDVGQGPDLGYLERAPRERDVTPIVATIVCRYRAQCEVRPDLCGCVDGPCDDVTPIVALPSPSYSAEIEAELDRLLACETRAIASRHQARARAYRERRLALLATAFHG